MVVLLVGLIVLQQIIYHLIPMYGVVGMIIVQARRLVALVI